MSELAVITPTFRGDAEIFADLHRSVLEFTPEDTVHYVVVPPRDRALFARYEGPRCRVWTSSELLPKRYLHVRLGRLETTARDQLGVTVGRGRRYAAGSASRQSRSR